VKKARFYDSNPKEFFIFFPSDWHIAKVNTQNEDQTLRVIVIKVDYID
jgi:beta-galactosidase beta subunit